MKRVVATIAVALSAGCESKPATPATPTAPPATAGPETKVDFDFTPPPARLALPPKLRAMRLPDGAVGTYVDAESPDGIPLRGVGLNLCQTGWMLQGYILRDGNVRATPHFLLPYAVLPTEPAGSPVPGVPGQTFAFDFETATPEQLQGKFEVVGAEGDAILSMQIDGAPVGVSTGNGIGAQGCFTTGFYELDAGEKLRGPATAIWDEERVYYIGLRLTERHSIGVWLTIEPAHRRPGNVMRGKLSNIATQPKKSPFHVVFETRKTTPAGVELQEIPAEVGELRASFMKSHPQGPIKLSIEGLEFPEWDGPMAGQRLNDVRVETLVVTDVDGPQVPVPSAPNFEPPKK